MKSILLYILLGISAPAIAQSKDSTFRTFRPCSYTYKLNYPKAAEANKISGIVLVEMDQNEDCILSNPRVIKGIGYGCDEEALRIVKAQIAGQNKCSILQKWPGCKKGKVTQPINFSYTDD
jgi:Gram-negative bacterial TonB protein C-terminal